MCSWDQIIQSLGTGEGGGDKGWGLVLFLVCLMFQQHAVVYFRDGSALTIWPVATTRQKLQITRIIIIITLKGAIQDFTISSLRREQSPTHTLKWPGWNHVQITFNSSSVYHVPLGMRDSLAVKSDRAEITFILAPFYWLKPLTLLSHPVAVCWHQANQPQCWPVRVVTRVPMFKWLVWISWGKQGLTFVVTALLSDRLITRALTESKDWLTPVATAL